MDTKSTAHLPSRLAGPALAVAVMPLLSGCSEGVLAPKGQIGAAEQLVLLDATMLMLCVVVPVIVATLAFAWWFRAGNRRATYLADWSYAGQLEVVVWAVPALVVLFLGGMAWVATHRLDPPRPIESNVPPIDVQVVSLDWKWLFIYPQQGIASVNHLVIPTGTPVRLQLTSASVMNSFFVPQLAGQIYTMHGMTTRLNLIAGQAGTYKGLSSQFSGDGFSDMRFDVVAAAPDQFAAWAKTAQTSQAALDANGYKALAKPSSAVPAAVFSHVQPALFDAIAAGQTPSEPQPQPATPAVTPQQRP